MKFTPAQLRKMGHDPDELRGEKTTRRAPPKADVGRVPGRPQPEQSGVYAPPDSLTFRVQGRPPRKGQGKKYIKKNQREQDRVKSAAMARIVRRQDLGRWPVDGECALSIVAVYPDHRHADLSNITKAVEDGLNGIVWTDDKRVREYREPMRIELSDHVGEGVTVVRVEVLS